MKPQGNGRSVFVTGSSTGIGRAAALELDHLGFRVFATVRRKRDAESLRAEASPSLKPLLLDVTDPRSIARARKDVASEVGPAGLWGLVNNAGISFRAALEAVPLEEIRRLYESNVFGAMAVTQVFLPLLRQARGRIINVSSLASFMVTPYHGPYSSAKASLDALSDALRMEMKPFGVTVTILHIGGVQTPLWEKAASLTKDIVRKYPTETPPQYLENQARAFEYFRKKGMKGLTADAAASSIVRALTAARPKTRYAVGSDARFMRLLSAVLHGRLRDAVILRSMGLPRSRR